MHPLEGGQIALYASIQPFVLFQIHCFIFLEPPLLPFWFPLRYINLTYILESCGFNLYVFILDGVSLCCSGTLYINRVASHLKDPLPSPPER